MQEINQAGAIKGHPERSLPEATIKAGDKQMSQQTQATSLTTSFTPFK